MSDFLDKQKARRDEQVRRYRIRELGQHIADCMRSGSKPSECKELGKRFAKTFYDK